MLYSREVVLNNRKGNKTPPMSNVMQPKCTYQWAHGHHRLIEVQGLSIMNHPVWHIWSTNTLPHPDYRFSLICYIIQTVND